MKFKVKFITNSDRAKEAYIEASTFGEAVTQVEDTANEYGEGFKCIKGAVKVGEPFEATIAELQEENKWISVKDRLPEVEGEYLVFVQVPPTRTHSNAERVMITKWFFTTGFVATQHKFITHWKPLTPPTV